MLTSRGDAKDAEVEVTFEDFVPAFVVMFDFSSITGFFSMVYFKSDLAHSSTLDNRKFIIRDSSKELKNGQSLQVGLSAKLLLPFGTPRIVEVNFNGRRICPDESLSFSRGNGCARFDKKIGETAGRWDGVLSVFSKIPKNHIRVDLVFDRKAWALGVSGCCRQ